MLNLTQWPPWPDTNKHREEWDQDQWVEVAIDAANTVMCLVIALNTPSAQGAIVVVKRDILLVIVLSRAKATMLTIHNLMTSCESTHPPQLSHTHTQRQL
jgi:hypothetical protein